jgi:hypothetical protein
MSDERDDEDWQAVCRLKNLLLVTIQWAYAKSAGRLTPHEAVCALTIAIGDVLFAVRPADVKDLIEVQRESLAELMENFDPWAAMDEKDRAGPVH